MEETSLRKSSVILLICLLVILSGCSLLPGLVPGRGEQLPSIPDDDPYSDAGLPAGEAVIYYCGDEGAIPGSEQILRQHHDRISYITGFWYQIEASNPTRLIPMWNSPEEEIKDAVRLAHSHGVKVEALFHNLLYGSSSMSEQIATRLITDRRLSEQLAQNLVDLARRMEFDGINNDIEFVPPALRHQFTAFVEIISRALKRESIRVSLSVPAKTGDDPWNGWSGGYDYGALGALVDRLMLMTYDEHGWASESDGPIASAEWVERVVQYAVREVPADKLILGIPAYGFRWTSGQRNPVYLDYVTAMGPIWRGEAVLGWDNEAQVPMYRYGGSDGNLHRVWFENASSSSWKLDIMRRYQLRGFALWRAGMEDPDFWRVVGQKMKAERHQDHGS